MLQFLSLVLAEAAPAAAAAGEGAPAGAPRPQGFDPFLIIMPLGLILVFYFLILRPQKQREKEHKRLLGSVKKGDMIRTIGGIHGEVVVVKDDYLIVLIDKDTGATIKLERSALGAVLDQSAGDATN